MTDSGRPAKSPAQLGQRYRRDGNVFCAAGAEDRSARPQWPGVAVQILAV